ncbi:caspase family protein [Devosia sp. CAU 1758]
MRFHAAFALVAIVALLALGAADPVLARDRALIVGVANYLNDEIGDLTAPDNDIVAMRSLAIDVFGYEAADVMVISNEEATRAGILDAFESWLVEGTAEGDRALFYFSGHGSQVAVPEASGGMRLTSTLVPFDASFDVLPVAEEPGGHVLGAQIGELIDRLSGRDVTIIADSCYSGSVTRGANLDADIAGNDARFRTITPTTPINIAPGDYGPDLMERAKTTIRLIDPVRRDGSAREGVAVWQAATLAQLAWESVAEDGKQRGIFTEAFVRGLRDLDADRSGSGRITASALLAHVREKAGAFCSSLGSACAAGFTPELLAPHSYRARVLAPRDVATVPFPPAEVPTMTASAVSDSPALVDLAEGLFEHENDFAVTAEILPSTTVPLGAAVQFRITSERGGQLVVLDTGPDGVFRRIYPNAYSAAAGQRLAIVAGAPLTIPDRNYPFEFIATDAGAGTLLVLVVEEDVDIGPLLESADFAAPDRLDRALLAVAADLQAPVLSPDPDIPNRARTWAYVSVPYSVE